MLKVEKDEKRAMHEVEKIRTNDATSSSIGLEIKMS